MLRATRYITSDIRREVRKECGFCCIFYGNLVCQYEHIVTFASDPSHDPANIVLLCATCHQNVTARRISKSEVSRQRQKPFAFQGRGHPYYKFLLGKRSSVKVGPYAVNNVMAEGDMTVFFLLPGAAHLRVQLRDGIPLFTGKILGPNGQPVFTIEENTIVLRATSIWDFRLNGTSMKISSGPRKVFADFTIKESVFSANSLRAVGNGAAIHIDRNSLYSYAGDGRHVEYNQISFSDARLTPGHCLPLATPLPTFPANPPLRVSPEWSYAELSKWLYARRAKKYCVGYAGMHRFSEIQFQFGTWAEILQEGSITTQVDHMDGIRAPDSNGDDPMQQPATWRSANPGRFSLFSYTRG